MAVLKKRLHKFNGASYDTIYFETKADMVLMSNGSTVEDAVNNHRSRHFRDGPDHLDLANIAFIGVNPLELADDTTVWWTNAQSGYAWFTENGHVTDQPAGYGFIINYAYGSDVFQLFKAQAGGDIWYRGGNASGWAGTWIKMLQPSDIATKLNTTGGRIANGDQCVASSKNFLLSVDHGTDNSANCGLQVRTRWGNSAGTILELDRGWNGSSAGSFPCLIVNGAGQTIVQSANVSESGGSGILAYTTTPMVRNISGGTSEPSSLTHGEIYVVYE